MVKGEVIASSTSNLAGVIVSGVETESIRKVIELESNIEVGSLDFLDHPDKLANLPPETVVGIGPGGEQYRKGAELPALPDDLSTPRCAQSS